MHGWAIEASVNRWTSFKRSKHGRRTPNTGSHVPAGTFRGGSRSLHHASGTPLGAHSWSRVSSDKPATKESQPLSVSAATEALRHPRPAARHGRVEADVTKRPPWGPLASPLVPTLPGTHVRSFCTPESERSARPHGGRVSDLQYCCGLEPFGWCPPSPPRALRSCMRLSTRQVTDSNTILLYQTSHGLSASSLYAPLERLVAVCAPNRRS
jgi:hypothetical protein